MLLKHLVSITALPIIVTKIVPAALVSSLYHETFWGLSSVTILPLLVAGLILIVAGLILLYLTISLFVKEGNGTIAPWNPTSKLIVSGVYRRVRNPMITAVFFCLIGESIILGSIPLTIWTMLFVFTNLIYIPLIEEKKLTERFGNEFLVYKESVPRWIPVLSRWKKD